MARMIILQFCTHKMFKQKCCELGMQSSSTPYLSKYRKYPAKQFPPFSKLSTI